MPRRCPRGQAWTDFCRALEQAGEVILRQRPDTPLDRAEGYRYLTRLLRKMLYTTLENTDPDFPRLQGLDRVKLGADNPDNVYLSAKSAATAPTGSPAARHDRLLQHRQQGQPLRDRRHHGVDRRAHRQGPRGRARRHRRDHRSATPHDRNWLPLAADSTVLVVRQTYLDRTTEEPGQWHIERVGEPIERKRLTRAPRQGARDGGLLGARHGRDVRRWTEMFMARPNELPDFGQEMFQKAGGDPEIFYLHGYWTLEPGQAWVIETEVPDCPYWNFQLDNWWMESLDHERKITINKHTAKLNEDGRLTLVVAEKDPGYGNWIDTCGHETGTALLRWLGASDTRPDLQSH